MNNEELEDFATYIQGSDNQRQQIYLKYMERYDETINFKHGDFQRSVTRKEFDADAYMAVHAVFEEISGLLTKSGIKLKSMFKKHLTAIARQNRLENQPLTKELKSGFRKSVRKKVYTGYETSCTIVPESIMLNMEYIDTSIEAASDLEDLWSAVTPDMAEPAYKDMVDHYINGKTLKEVAGLERNGGISKQAVQKRLKNYLDTIARKIEGEG